MKLGPCLWNSAVCQVLALSEFTMVDAAILLVYSGTQKRELCSIVLSVTTAEAMFMAKKRGGDVGKESAIVKAAKKQVGFCKCSSCGET
eukprot:5125790-Amphidinium_carterae.1